MLGKVALALAAFACGATFGQIADSDLRFEEASVASRTAADDQGRPGGRGADPLSYYGYGVLRDFLFSAYGLDDPRAQIQGPEWINTERYEIVAKIPAGTTKRQSQLMLQNLLTERFRLLIHHESKELPVYELVVGASGSKLKESAGVPDTPAPSPNQDGPKQTIRLGVGGSSPTMPAGPGLVMGLGPGRLSRWTARQQRVSALVQALRSAAVRLIVDKTGLTGTYDFTLEYDREIPGDGAPHLTLLDAVQEQLGLKLVDATAPFDVVVIDRAEKVSAGN